LKPNSNYDLSLLRYLFKTLLGYSEILDTHDNKLWQDALASLDELYVNQNNVLMLDSEESLMESHRHHSHAMAIYPLRLLDYNNSQKDRDIIDATINDLERLGTGLWVGFSFTWMAALYAVQRNGEGAAYQLRLFWENICSPNGFHLNGDYKKRGISSLHYRPFTLEANMCALDALQEMLLDDKDGINVFPAIPIEWKEKGVAFQDFRAFRGLLVSAEIKDCELVCIKLKPNKTGKYKIHNTFAHENIIIQCEGEELSISCKVEECFMLNLQTGKEYLLR
jgi:alpha-L-fucosidase 2